MGNKCVGKHMVEEVKHGEEGYGSAVDHEDSSQMPDWDDENSVHHRSAMNSLHNYALGKMTHLANDEPQKSPKFNRTTSSRSSRSLSIKFADELHQSILFERPSIDFCSDDGQPGFTNDCQGVSIPLPVTKDCCAPNCGGFLDACWNSNNCLTPPNSGPLEDSYNKTEYVPGTANQSC
mmetsp:Transcript_47068/g.125161  ORF Transcript_47068/g.125161 Transcript_47068/m.125161 type:complete len:178 (-) Transcript_47068:470-1003(-)